MAESSKRGRQSQVHRDVRRPSILPQPSRIPGFLLELPNHREGWLVARRVRMTRRLLGAVIWTLPCMAVQAVLLWLPNQAKVRFARAFFAGLTWLLGIKVRVAGQPLPRGGRAVVFVSNHSS